MILEKVFGVINDKLETQITRKEIEECFKRAILQKKQLVVYGSSKQGKTTLLNTHIKHDRKITIRCSASTDLSDIYKMILQKINVTIQSSSSSESSDMHQTKFNFKVKLLTNVESEVEIISKKDKRDTLSELQLDISSAQGVAELLKEHFPDKVVVFENFHYLDERVQQLFAFDLRTFQDIDVRVVILGIWREKNRLVQNNGDLQDRIFELSVEPWEEVELQQIISLGEKSLNIDMRDIKDQLIVESFCNVGMLQELCKECCYDANVLETVIGEPKKITIENLQRVINKIANTYSGKFYRSLETFAYSRSRKSQDGGKGLGIPYFFIYVILSKFTVEQIQQGVSIDEIKNEIKKIHPEQNNMQFDRSLTVFLNRIQFYQQNHNIIPSIFDFDCNSKRLNITDPNFFFFIKHQSHQDFLNALKKPQGYENLVIPQKSQTLLT